VDYIKNNSLECIGYLNKFESLYIVLYTFLLTNYIIGNNIYIVPTLLEHTLFKYST